MISHNSILLLPTHPLSRVRSLRSSWLSILNMAASLFTELHLLWEEGKRQNPAELVGRELEPCLAPPLSSGTFKPSLINSHSHKKWTKKKKPSFQSWHFSPDSKNVWWLSHYLPLALCDCVAFLFHTSYVGNWSWVLRDGMLEFLTKHVV